MSTLRQTSAVDRAADLFASIAAQGPATALWQVLAAAMDNGMTAEEVIDALAFLEAAGLISFQTVVEVLRPTPPQAMERAA